eukprot:PhM_4_TR8099/c0_g2_i1/m.60498
MIGHEFVTSDDLISQYQKILGESMGPPKPGGSPGSTRINTRMVQEWERASSLFDSDDVHIKDSIANELIPKKKVLKRYPAPPRRKPPQPVKKAYMVSVPPPTFGYTNPMPATIPMPERLSHREVDYDHLIQEAQYIHDRRVMQQQLSKNMTPSKAAAAEQQPQPDGEDAPYSPSSRPPWSMYQMIRLFQRVPPVSVHYRPTPPTLLPVPMHTATEEAHSVTLPPVAPAPTAAAIQRRPSAGTATSSVSSVANAARPRPPRSSPSTRPQTTNGPLYEIATTHSLKNKPLPPQHVQQSAAAAVSSSLKSDPPPRPSSSSLLPDVAVPSLSSVEPLPQRHVAIQQQQQQQQPSSSSSSIPQITHIKNIVGDTDAAIDPLARYRNEMRTLQMQSSNSPPSTRKRASFATPGF